MTDSTDPHVDGYLEVPLDRRPTPVIVVHPDAQAVAEATAARLLLALIDTLAQRDVAHVALTGGSLGSAALACAADSALCGLVDWSRVHLWWGDERYLPAGHTDRNDTQNGAALLDRLIVDGRLPPENMHRVAGPDTSGDVEASAAAYGQQIRADGSGAWDVVLLGMGPDGHVASLFPHHPAARTTDAVAVAVHGSPKPPPERVSLTFECLRRARRVWLLVSGPEKAAAVARALAPGADSWDVPATGVRGVEHTLWLLDLSAAADLPATAPTE